jgi:uncharacterized membrane-anchored protein
VAAWLFFALLAAPGGAQGEAPVLEWEDGPLVASVGGDLAEIDVPEGFVFLGKEGTGSLLQLMENPVSGQELATLSSKEQGVNWFIFFEWNPVGWVDDSDQDELDPEGLLSSIRDGNQASNAEREKRGWSTLEIVGWRESPHYDAATHNLTWAITARSEGHEIVNRNVKLLGRHGVMSATLVADPEDLAGASVTADRLLTGFRFKPGSTYAEYLPGSDKVAQYGLTALVAGGAGAALVKSGLLARFWKLLVVGAGALVAGLGRIFRGRRPPNSQYPQA